MTMVSHHDEQAVLPGPSSRLSPYVVDRQRIDHLYRVAEGRLLRVLAPSGYGKSSLVKRWVAADARCVRWVDASRGDDDPVTLFDTLRNALAGIFDIPLAAAAHAATSDPYVDAFEHALSGQDPTAPFVLVLDDVHRVRSAGGNWLIRSLVEHLPADSTVVLVGRGHHDHGTIGKLRLDPGVVDVSVDQLALDTFEAYELLDRMDIDTAQPGLSELLAQLEGWPAGIRLAGELLRSGVPPWHLGDRVDLVEYLSGEWLGELDVHDRSFLREAACLEQFSADECDEVLERRGSHEAIERLHRDQSLVFALDWRNERYRLHGLLGRWLAAQLKRDDPRRWTAIHANASRYFEQHGDIDVAAEHAIAAADLPLLESLVTEHGGRYFANGRSGTVEKWLDAFPSDHIRTSPGPIGLRCVEALHHGDAVRAVEWLRVLDQSLAAHNGPADELTSAWANVLHAALDERPAADLIPIVVAARDQLVGGPWGAFADWVHGGLAFMIGDVVAARGALEAGEFDADLDGAPLLVGLCAATSSIIDACQGDDVASAPHAERAHESTAWCCCEVLPPSALSLAVATLQHACRGEREAAVRGIEVAGRSLARYRSVAPWLNVIARLPLIRAAMLLDDRATARALLQELEHHARHEPDWSGQRPHSAIACAQRLRTQVELMHVPATGSSALTDAEIRVLQLLPTNLSLAEIATLLFLSRNTVKSHAAAIYRKLDATRRGDAVDRARAAGLLSAAPTT